MSMTSKIPCKYYKQGRCNKGANCAFSHGNSYSYNSGDNNNNGRAASPFWSDNILDQKADEMIKDLSEKKSFQSLGFSAYSLPQASLNLISKREISPEELRMEYLTNPQQYELHVKARTNDYQKVMSFLQKDTRKATRFLQAATQRITQGSDPSTIRSYIDFNLDLNDTGNSAITSGGFGGAFFGNSGFGSKGAAFGQNPFASTTTTTPAFGASFGSSGFGSTSTAVPAPATNTSAFGSSAFGASAQPQPAFGATAFGSSAPAATSSGFGSSGFGSSAPSNNASAFGSSGFGSGMPSTNASAFGASTFGSAAPNNAPTFGSSGLGSTGKSAFGSFKSNTTSAFGNLASNAPATSSPFGGVNANENKPSIFGASNASPFATTAENKTGPNAVTSVFGSAPQAQAQAQPSPFGNIGGAQVNSFASNATGNFKSAFGSENNGSSAASPFGNISTQASASLFGSANQAPTQSAFNQQPQSAPPVSNTFGAANNFAKKDTTKNENSTEVYSVLDDLTEGIRKLFETPGFQLGSVPEVPPPIELC